MSASSTVSNSYINNNSWLQPQGHGLSSSSTSSSSCSQQQQLSSLKSSKKAAITATINNNNNSNNSNKGMALPNGSNGNRRPSKLQSQQDGFARSTASSRSRAGTTADDSGVSQNAIYEAFAQAEKQLDKTATTNNKPHHLSMNPRRLSVLPSDLRRKSMAETSTRRRSSRVGDSSTATTNATGTTPPTPVAAGMLSPPQRTRAHSLAVVSNTRRRSTTNTTTTTTANTTVRRPAPPPSLLNPQHDENRGKPSPSIGPTTTSLRTSSMNRPSNRTTTTTTAAAAATTTTTNFTKKPSPSSPCLDQAGSSTTCSSMADQPSCRSPAPRGASGKSSEGTNHHQPPPTQPDPLVLPLDRQEPGLIRLVDALRDTLAVERQKAKRELAMHLDTKATTASNHMDDTNTDDARPAKQKPSPRQPPTSTTNKKQQPSGVSPADIIYHAKRRLTTHCIDNTATESVDSPPKATATQSQLERRASLMAYVRQRSHPNEQQQQQQQPPFPSTAAGITSPDTPTTSTSLARLQQRGSLSSSHQLKTAPQLSQSSPRQSPVPQRQRKKSLQPIITTTNTCSSSSSASSASPSGGATNAATTVRLRKKSMVGGNNHASEATTATATAATAAATSTTPTTLTASLARRRRSRTESLKDGVPIASSSPAATTAPTTPRSRKKSLVGTSQQQETAASATKPTSTAKKPMVPPPTYTRKRGKTLPGNLAKPPIIQPTAQLPPMKMEPIQIALPKQKQQQQQQRQHGPSRNGRNSSHHRSHTEDGGLESGGEETAMRLKKKTPTPARASRRSSTAATPNKKKASPTGAAHLISTSRRPSMPQLSTQSSARKLSISVAKQGGWYAYGDHPEGTKPGSSATSVPNSPGLAATRVAAAAARKQAIQGRKNSLGNPATGSAAMVLPDQDTTLSVEKDRTRAMSLHEKLQAMVAQHTMQNNSNSNSGDTERRTRKSQNYDIDDKYYEHRLRTHRLSEPFLYGSDHAAPLGDNVARSPQNALRLYGPCLSSFERHEIQDYSDIYFVGPYAKKIPASAPSSSPPAPPSSNNNNHGYDDERGDYLIIRQDHLAYRYEILEELGRGSFGQVVKCFDHKTNTSVAIKLIRNKRRFHEQALMEVKILKDLVAWDPDDGHHNVRMTDYFYFRNHLCIVCECLSINLYEFIKKYDYKGFAVSLIKRFALQLLRSLCLLYDHDVIHCDLKPENILLKHPAKSTIKVIDFGSSCFTNEKMYTYIQSRFYRAPEIILGTTYNTAIDMWSFGCILAELYTGIPIFPGETEQEQLACIMEILGVPDDNLIHRCSRRKLFFDSNNRPRPVINSRGKQRIAGAKTLAGVLRCQQEPLFLDFIQCCLQWDPDRRLTPYDALQHPWFTTSTNKPHQPPAVPASAIASPAAALAALPT